MIESTFLTLRLFSKHVRIYTPKHTQRFMFFSLNLGWKVADIARNHQSVIIIKVRITFRSNAKYNVILNKAKQKRSR